MDVGGFGGQVTQGILPAVTGGKLLSGGKVPIVMVGIGPMEKLGIGPKEKEGIGPKEKLGIG